MRFVLDTEWKGIRGEASVRQGPGRAVCFVVIPRCFSLHCSRLNYAAVQLVIENFVFFFLPFSVLILRERDERSEAFHETTATSLYATSFP